MRKISVILFILLYSSLIWSQTANDIFKSMPFEIVPGLTEEDKDMMMIDKGSVSVPSQLGEIVKVAHSDTYIKLTTSKVGATQIKILESESDSLIICVIKTVCDDICDSNIKFFSKDWEELDRSEFLEDISIDSFLSSKDITNTLSTDIVLPLFYPLIAELDAESNDLAIKINLENILSKEQLEEVKPYIVQSEIEFKWNGTSFYR